MDDSSVLEPQFNLIADLTTPIWNIEGEANGREAQAEKEKKNR